MQSWWKQMCPKEVSLSFNSAQFKVQFSIFIQMLTVAAQDCCQGLPFQEESEETSGQEVK